MDLWKRLRRERHRREGAQAVAGEALPMESVGAPGAMDTGHGEGLSPQRLSGPSSSNRLSMPSRRDTICEARMEATANSNTTAGDISYANSQTPLTRLRSTSAASSTPSSLGRHLPEQHPRRSSDLLEAGPRMPPLAPSSSSGTPSSGLTTPLATPTEQDSLVVVAFESGDASKEAGSPSRQLFPPRKHPSLNPVRAAPAKRRRLLFSNPVTTISSTVATAAGTARTSKNAKKHHDDRKDVKDEEAAVESIVIHAGMLPVKSDISNASALPSPTAAPTEHVLSYGNGKGNEGVLRRVYDLWALTSLGLANIGPLQGALFGVFTAKEYGGYAVLAIGWPISGLFMCIFSAIMAEFASSYPVAGAMYTWTFRLCRLSPSLRPLARFLSWFTGSFLLCGHILAQMLVEWQFAITLQGLVIMYADYTPTTWKTIFIAWAGALATAVLAASTAGRSPYLWKSVSVLFGATAVIIIASVLACNSYRNPASVIFGSYVNMTGFTSKGFVYMLGWMLTSIATGQDVAAHLAEEAKYPTRTVPKAIFWSTACAYLVGWAVMLAIMAVFPEVVNDAPPKAHAYGAPALLLSTLVPQPLAFIILLLIVLLMKAQDTAQLLASTRFIWALARDSALPFSHFFRHLSISRLPVRATYSVCLVVCLSLMLIATDRAIATSLMLQGCGASIILAYSIPVVCYLTCEKGALDVDGRNEWTLRNWSKPAAWVGTAYVSLIIIFMSCPNDWPVTATSFSYAAVVLVFVALASALTWMLYGNAHYAGPIKSITVYTIGREVDLPKSNNTHPTNKQTPHDGKPTAGLTGSNVVTPGVETGIDFGKTANIYSESLATIDRSSREDIRMSRGQDQTETQYTDESYDSWSGSSDDEDGETDGGHAGDEDLEAGRASPARSRQQADLQTSPFRQSQPIDDTPRQPVPARIPQVSKLR